MSKSRDLAKKLLYAAFEVLKEAGGQLPGREVMKRIEDKIKLSEWAKEKYEKTGYIRWQTILHFYTIGATKASYLIKKKGSWYLTKEGEDALRKGADYIMSSANKAYKKWDQHRKKLVNKRKSENKLSLGKFNISLELEGIEQKSLETLKEFIKSKNAYEFQDIVAALLESMGYNIPFISPRGKDGGIDIIAYQDPLGVNPPRIKIQVKHRENPTNVQEIRQLIGVLTNEEVGIFVSTGGFTSDALKFTRSAQFHIELIDFDRFISLWQEFYNKMSDENKNKIPLTSIYFLLPEE